MTKQDTAVGAAQWKGNPEWFMGYKVVQSQWWSKRVLAMKDLGLAIPLATLVVRIYWGIYNKPCYIWLQAVFSSFSNALQ